MNCCFSCFGLNLRSICRFRNAVYHSRGKIGHIRMMYRQSTCNVVSMKSEAAEEDVSYVLTLRLPTDSTQFLYRNIEFQDEKSVHCWYGKLRMDGSPECPWPSQAKCSYQASYCSHPSHQWCINHSSTIAVWMHFHLFIGLPRQSFCLRSERHECVRLLSFTSEEAKYYLKSVRNLKIAHSLL